MPNYRKCPRCDLNWITDDEELCEVCKAELGIKSKIVLLEDDDSTASAFGGKLCPICGINYISEDEDMCDTCRIDQGSKKRSSRKAQKEASQLISGFQDERNYDPDAIDADSLDAMEEDEVDEQEDEENFEGEEVFAQDSIGVDDDDFTGPVLHGYEDDEPMEEEYEEEPDEDDDDFGMNRSRDDDTDDLDDMEGDLSDEEDDQTRRK
ncbi:MAG: hypothetical protein J5656_06645 [Clostridia bacterium]|nr:hypothetical protein [Clostridia bacterium]